MLEYHYIEKSRPIPMSLSMIVANNTAPSVACLFDKKGASVSEEKAIAHLETIRQDVRDEVKRRIEQRDKYSIQMTIALGALIAVSFSTTGLRTVLIAVPLVSIYFTVLILYSYKIHRLLAQYLREEVEPELARLCGTAPDKEWETYYSKHAVPGIRRWFFQGTLWAVVALSLFYLWSEKSVVNELGKTALIVVTIVYALLAVGVSLWDVEIFKKIRQMLRKRSQ
jgi:fatty acid desaturase